MPEVDITLEIQTDESTTYFLSSSCLITIVTTAILFVIFLAAFIYSIIKGIPTWVIIFLGFGPLFYGYSCSVLVLRRWKRKKQLSKYLIF